MLLHPKLRSPFSHGPQMLQLLRAHWGFLFDMRIYHINVTWCYHLCSLLLAILNCTCFFSRKGFSLCILSLAYAPETAQGKIWHKVRMRKNIRKDVLSCFSQNVPVLKSELGFWIWLEICIYLMCSWFDLGLLCLTNGAIFGDSLIKGYLWRSFWKERGDFEMWGFRGGLIDLFFQELGNRNVK